MECDRSEDKSNHHTGSGVYQDLGPANDVDVLEGDEGGRIIHEGIQTTQLLKTTPDH